MRIALMIFSMTLGMSSMAQLLGVDDHFIDQSSYFISFDKDTIYGEVQYPKTLFSNRLRKIHFIDLDGYKYKLMAKHSNGFMMNGTFYISKVVDEMYYFLRPAVSGTPALFVLEKNSVGRERHSLAMLRVDESESKVIDRFLENNGKMHKLYERRFKKQAPQLFESYPEVVEMITLDEFTFDDIEEIVLFCNYSDDGLSEHIEKK